MNNINDYRIIKLVWSNEIPGLGPVRSDYVGQGFFTMVDVKTGYQPVLANLFGFEQRLVKTANAVRSYLFDIAALYTAADYHGLDIERLMLACEPLRRRECDMICSAMQWKRVSDVAERVAPSTIARRLSTIQSFLNWGFARSVDRLSTDDKRRDADRKLAAMRHFISQYVPRKSEIVEATKSPMALSNEQIAVLRLALSPGSNNPFRSTNNNAEQYRNAALVMMLVEAGMRPAELCVLELVDLFFEDSALWISKWMSDVLPSDAKESEALRRRRKFPRRSTVGHKTVGRKVVLGPVLMEMLSEYVETHRNTILKKCNKKRSPYLFISTRDGGPMTPSGIRSIAQRISVCYPALPKLTSYTFRHTSVTVSAEVMRRAVSHLPSLAADQKFSEALTNKYGWSATSAMVAHYSQADLNRVLAELASAQIYSESNFSHEEGVSAKDA